MSADPIALLFGGMEKLAPGSDADTRRMLRSLPKRTFDIVVDAGCGAGRQTMVLARDLGATIHAVDAHQPFLDELGRRAAQAGVSAAIQPHCMDMAAIPERFPAIDLLWSEGAAYNIGFAHALTVWRRALRPGAVAGVSELVWLDENPPADARAFFASGYPDMRSAADNLAAIQDAGYTVLDMYTLPREAWMDGYYDILEPRAWGLLGHDDGAVRDFAREMLREIDVFKTSGRSYGYVFYLLQRA